MNPPPIQSDDEYPDIELSAAERRRLRQMMDADRRARWFWTTVRTWIMWIGGTATAITIFYQGLKDAIKFLAR